ncbi:conserved hypothetical protein [Vibrio rotiferianus]|uniref:hypothetical protein n=1 Tax=Vibrio rotiferianus TaxID=190895 RepID=UPI002894F2DC|nr:conserved hypothetical protein [Vibrio rotiferianus]
MNKVCKCHDLGYDKFDSISKKELANPISLTQVVNDSYSNCIMINEIKNSENASLKEVFSKLKGQVGVYCLWLYITDCPVHDKQKFECLYVGKGDVVKRLKEHFEEKWSYPKIIHITFFECENRIAKYIEQLCLDTFEFAYNSKENCGTGKLYAMWSQERGNGIE